MTGRPRHIGPWSISILFSHMSASSVDGMDWFTADALWPVTSAPDEPVTDHRSSNSGDTSLDWLGRSCESRSLSRRNFRYTSVFDRFRCPVE